MLRNERGQVDAERGGSLPETAILLVAIFSLVSGALDVASGGISKAFEDADEAVDASTELVPGIDAVTIDFWLENVEAWPVDQLVVGDTIHDQAGLREVLELEPDKPASIAQQLIVTEMNILAGTEGSCVDETIRASHEWLIVNPVGTSGSEVDEAWAEDGENLHTMLGYYNNGQIVCAERKS